MKYYEIITLKDGRQCCLRNGTEADGEAARDCFILTHEQTDYLLTYPDENSVIDVQQEAQFLKDKTESADEIEILAEVDGKVAGMAGIERMGSQEKVRHRADFGVSVDQTYCKDQVLRVNDTKGKRIEILPVIMAFQSRDIQDYQCVIIFDLDTGPLLFVQGALQIVQVNLKMF